MKELIKRLLSKFLGKNFFLKRNLIKTLEDKDLLTLLNNEQLIEILPLFKNINLANPEKLALTRNVIHLLNTSREREAVNMLLDEYFESKNIKNELLAAIYQNEEKISRLVDANINLTAATFNITRNKGELASIADAEYRVYSQFGQDGIIQFLINNLQIDNKKFVEFGVEDYSESTTRYLLVNNNWQGLVMDGSKENIAKIKKDNIYWRHTLTARNEFITKENINSILKAEGFTGDIGLLVIDIDGNDYWIWKEIDVVKPIIVFCEFNSNFGNNHKVTIPYKADFYRTDAHYSNLYFGVSLPALKDLAASKGYTFFSCNTAGNDAVFVRNDYYAKLPKIKTKDYVTSLFRESRDQNGETNYLAKSEQLKEIQDQFLQDIGTMKVKKIKDIYAL